MAGFPFFAARTFPTPRHILNKRLLESRLLAFGVCAEAIQF